MARYRKVDVRIWKDERFKRLSPIPACGQGLWLYLLTNRFTTNIPGCYSIGERALAEDLGWEIEAFREAFREACSQGMVKADFQAPLIFIPKAIFYNIPESPNVVRSWRQSWDEFPTCKLKFIAYNELRCFLEGLSEGFRKAFLEACGQASANQEQEQEQEQDTIFIQSVSPEKPKNETPEKPDPLPTTDGRGMLINPEVVLDVWNEICVKRGLPKISLGKLSSLEVALQYRNREREFWGSIFLQVIGTPFMMGNNERGFVCTLPFLLEKIESIGAGDYESWGKELAESWKRRKKGRF